MYMHVHVGVAEKAGKHEVHVRAVKLSASCIYCA